MKVNGFNPQVHTEGLIAAALSAGRFPHAVIIEGGTPEERLALAEKIAAALVCADETEIPCGACPHCMKASRGMHPDITVWEPRVEKGRKEEAFSVDYVREIRESAFVIPNEAERKISILTEAHKMNEQGQNAFLKVLEEPPKYAVFILLCSSKNIFIETILSRVTCWSIGEAVDTGKDELPREKLVEAAESVAKAIAADKDSEIIRAAGIFDKDQKLLQATLPVMEEIFACALRIKFNAPEDNSFESAPILAERLSRRTLLRLIDHTGELETAVKFHANLNLTTARLCALYRSAAEEQE